MVYGVEPDLTREGGSIPVTLTLQVIVLWLNKAIYDGGSIATLLNCTKQNKIHLRTL